MEVTWTAKALSDLERLYEFLVPFDPKAAARIAQRLASAPRRACKTIPA